MTGHNFLSRFTAALVRKFFTIEENKSRKIGNPGSILIVRQHNQFGDLLASVSLFRAIKETFPGSNLTVLSSPENYYAITKNKFIDRMFIFNKKKLLSPIYFFSLRRILKGPYDLTIVPATVSISFTSCLLGRLSNSKIRIGPNSLNGKNNQYAFLFDRRVDLDWRKYPDAHISDFGLEVLRPFGISTKNFKSSITFDETDVHVADEFVKSTKTNDDSRLIGLHVGAGKPANRWSLQKFIKLMERLKEDYNCEFFLTGSNSDKDEIDYVIANTKFPLKVFLNRTIPQLAALISKADIFITNDTGVMHVAGTTETPQISIFGPTNPFNWAPLGSSKYFIRKSELIDDVTVNDVYELCEMILEVKKEKNDNNE
ncbi:MAG: glycosyltransferase family 9 protein [Melioribacteraceae bacterium]|nr:glycosyltransferase family 9 protein [Melioribacteraceae bacterium]MCF8353964.1 glycosyltransferase family 9 protein [Melioribacteraceae bacterium]MCF8393692.1 glycosyltransferase family 9 protein [Melioribacteraceae bacterium]MCF8419566.1 glycosyltransferase family 9 protein [Melioribacteraceae bacterium]